MKVLPFLTRKIAFLNFILYLCVCFVCMNLCARRGYRYPQKPEGIGSPGTGIKSGCELPDMRLEIEPGASEGIICVLNS